MGGHQSLRVLSGSQGHYGAAASQDFTPYENFQGKARSVLLIVYLLFLKVFLEKRKDLLDNVFS
ncbi:hypothetical protein DSF51_19205 [Salmonella enterica subsp. enterica serovar Sarajane]|uniref:hypothetical protein n=1 Tax=Salmonella bongori TaxID=54736 RepID=UPI00137EBB1D|nr:hypothetical protein [Salmonella bongori]EBX5008154.1 hypothetical protein [Salmonella enterica subsp. enterica serovar Sarajane]EEC4228439.1 hypothetical protein [Salmonella enterica subsp. enterica serovar Typhimurium]EED7506334.1 hypothetical protein [Salmonella enterica subsp. enterica serovar Stanleyville]EGE4653765.1 hypothetical protein [Salmonella bongori serovar 40:z35:- str. 95-0123]EJJ1296487.1 hypothetical protein [Salmonella enterica]HAU3268134.1 hypothetical protein [Salmonel